MDKANDIVIACRMAGIRKAKTFTASRLIPDTMTKAGVMDKPQSMCLSPTQ